MRIYKCIFTGKFNSPNIHKPFNIDIFGEFRRIHGENGKCLKTRRNKENVAAFGAEAWISYASV